MLFVSPDYRAKTSWMGPAAEADMLDLIAWLRRERGVERIYVCGGSMGGTSALTFAARHPDLVSVVVAMNPLADHLFQIVGDGSQQRKLNLSVNPLATKIPVLKSTRHHSNISGGERSERWENMVQYERCLPRNGRRI